MKKIARTGARKKHRHLSLRAALLALLLLCACTPAPVKLTTTALPARPATLPPPQESPPLCAEIPQAEVAPLEPETTLPPTAPSAPEAMTATALNPLPEANAAPLPPFASYASYYAKRFNGRRTYTGERYDPEGMTAATRDFPLQSWLRVINPANHKEVIVRVNDRTGKRKTPLVDLSRAAAKELGFLGKGRIRVEIIPLLAAP